MSRQLPMELLDKIAHYLPFDELWRVRNVNFRWNETALRRAWSLLYVGSAIHLVAIQSAFHPGGMQTDPVTMTPRQTDGKPDTDVLTWYSPELVFRPEYEIGEYSLNFGWLGITISLPQTHLKRIHWHSFRSLMLWPEDGGSEEQESGHTSKAR